MKFIIALTSALLVALGARAQEDSSNMPCGPWEAVRDGLEKKYGEVPTKIGRGNDAYIVLFEGPETMTVVVVMPDERACFAGAAKNWKPYPERPKGKGA